MTSFFISSIPMNFIEAQTSLPMTYMRLVVQLYLLTVSILYSYA